MFGAIDIVILVFFGVFFLIGFLKGFTRQIWGMIMLAGAVCAVIFLSRPFAGILLGMGAEGWFGDLPASFAEIALTAICGLALFIMVYIVGTILRLVFKRKKKEGEKQSINVVNRLLGGALKCLQAFVIVSIVASLFGLIGKAGIMPESFDEYVRGSIIGNWFYEGQWLDKMYQFVLSLG